MSEWRSIETAPKNNGNVLVAWRSYGGGTIVGEAYCHSETGRWWWANLSDGDYHTDALSPDPTHWQPLPEPPK